MAGAKYVEAPEFVIHGNPGGIFDRVTVMQTRASDYTTIAESLTSLTTDGWTGRAADRFRERFEVEPQRWTEAAEGFTNAAIALEAYANDLAQAQTNAVQCRTDYAEGNRVTEKARTQYEANVAEGHLKKATWEAAHGPGTFNLTILPFQDPGQALRKKAISDFQDLISGLDKSAQTTANLVRAACANAPEKRNWLETGLAFIGGIFIGAAEAAIDLGKLLASGPVDLCKLLTGELTPEEFGAKFQLSLETVQQMWEALQSDPLGFGKELVKGLLDWDTWSDDPARAIGHLMPDLVAALMTQGTGLFAARGANVANKIDDVTDVLHAGEHATDFAKTTSRLSRTADDAGDLSDRSRTVNSLDDITDTSRFSRGAAGGDIDEWINHARRESINLSDIDPPPKDIGIGATDADHIQWQNKVDEWINRVAELHPELDSDQIASAYHYTTNEGYTAINNQLRFPDPNVEPEVLKDIENISNLLDRLPNHDGVTFRGTGIPQSKFDEMLSTGIIKDPAFISSSESLDVARGFATQSNPGEVRIIFDIDSRSGSNISRLSAYGSGEAEVLFKPGSQFKVDLNGRYTDNEGFTHFPVTDRP